MCTECSHISNGKSKNEDFKIVLVIIMISISDNTTMWIFCDNVDDLIQWLYNNVDIYDNVDDLIQWLCNRVNIEDKC